MFFIFKAVQKILIPIIVYMMFLRNSMVRTMSFNSQRLTNSGLHYGNPRQMNPILISIEGNIGAGKTTLLKNLRERMTDWNFIDEPVATWNDIKNEEGDSILEIFYKDRKRWSYTFQNCALLTRYQNIESAVESARQSGKLGNQVFFTERCLDTDYHVFTNMLHAEGSIDKLELHLYRRLLSQLKKTATPLNAIIHVNTKPSICSGRIAQRARSGEEAISLEYLTSLDAHQTSWIQNTELPTLSTDMTRTTVEVEKFVQDLLIEASSLIGPSGSTSPPHQHFN